MWFIDSRVNLVIIIRSWLTKICVDMCGSVWRSYGLPWSVTVTFFLPVIIHISDSYHTLHHFLFIIYLPLIFLNGHFYQIRNIWNNYSVVCALVVSYALLNKLSPLNSSTLCVSPSNIFYNYHTLICNQKMIVTRNSNPQINTTGLSTDGKK